MPAREPLGYPLQTQNSLFLLRVLTVVFSGLKYGRWDYFLHLPGPLFGLPDDNFPKDWGYNLAEVYLIWIVIVTLLYLPCRWMMKVKQESRSRWLSYV